jgi:hypothetical protein
MEQKISILWCIPVTIAVVFSPIIDLFLSSSGIFSYNQGLLSPGQFIRGGLIILLFIPIIIRLLMKQRVFVNGRFALIDSPILPLIYFVLYCIITSIIGSSLKETIIFISKIVYLILIYLNVFMLVGFGLIGRRWLLYNGAIIIVITMVSQYAGYQSGLIGYGIESSFVGLTGKSYESDLYMALVPIFFLNYNYKILLTLLPIIITLLSSIASMRRSSTIVNFISTVTTLIFIPRISNSYRSQIFSRLIFIIILIVPLACILFLTQTGHDFMERLSDINIYAEGTGSGRMEFIPIAWNNVTDRSLYHFLFGESMQTMRNLMLWYYGMDIGSHNLLIDIMFAYGFIGGLLYVWFNVRILKMFIYSKSEVRAAAFATTICVILSALVAGRGFSPNYAPLYALIGYMVFVNSQHVNPDTI